MKFIAGADPRIRIEDLLSMTVGYGRQLNFGETDPSALAARPLVNSPGTTFNYDSGSSDLLAEIIARVTGMLAERNPGPRATSPSRGYGGGASTSCLAQPRGCVA